MVGRNGQVVGYVRVSSADQNEARQVEAIGPVDRLFSEKVSGKSTDRAQLQEMLAYVREGDTVKVLSLPRRKVSASPPSSATPLPHIS